LLKAASTTTSFTSPAHFLKGKMVGMIWVDEDRLAELSNLLKDIAGYAVCFERFDPQFKAVRRLVESFGCGGASVLAVANSIISYQLSTRGEVY